MLLNHLDAQPVTCGNAGGKNKSSKKIAVQPPSPEQNPCLGCQSRQKRGTRASSHMCCFLH